MKMYRHSTGFILTGKAWEVREYLKQLSKRSNYVRDFRSPTCQSNAAAIPKKNKLS
ncbi:Z-ring formation inhibitor MciZ [Evansella halocellulosilytica]|uniref:Z-ring formation inhibitor MciZ n=1 Tax=Evansella halocellulosilytica TaxID=2011013 RepID=UPI000BB6C2DE